LAPIGARVGQVQRVIQFAASQQPGIGGDPQGAPKIAVSSGNASLILSGFSVVCMPISWSVVPQSETVKVKDEERDKRRETP
jgi:hypothetical protein